MMKERSRIYVSVRAIVVAIALVAVLVPFLYLFLNSVKIEREFRSIPPRIIPFVVTLQYYADIFGRGGQLGSYLLNSIIVTLVVVVVSVFTGALAAFGLAKLRRMYRFIALAVYLILLVRFYPKVVMLIPYFILMRDLHLLDTLAAVVIAHSSIGIPFVVWLMIGFYEEIPIELEESAMLDGCDVWRRFTRVIFPVVLPGIATAAIMTAILSWNEFLIASSVVSINAKTLPVLVSGYISDKGINWGPMSATSVVIIVPMFVFVLFTQKYLVRGLTFGAVKG
jgi:multiple sugar transport system permease protein